MNPYRAQIWFWLQQNWSWCRWLVWGLAGAWILTRCEFDLIPGLALFMVWDNSLADFQKHLRDRSLPPDNNQALLWQHAMIKAHLYVYGTLLVLCLAGWIGYRIWKARQWIPFNNGYDWSNYGNGGPM
ncbi:MAG: hypothetical protein JST12_08370 [Armatimonadetes bacterium]|nr:hypothetical protein [Armatimonadota bacterium]